MGIADWGVGELVYRVSLVLLYPVLALLGLSLLKVMWHLGELVHDAWTMRHHRNPKTARQLRDICAGTGNAITASLAALTRSRWQHPHVRRFVGLLLDELGRGRRDTLAPRIDHLVGQVQAGLARDVNRVRVLVRLGPCLGLAGTLIPLGPGLVALSEGDLGRLSAQLVVAFSTTVVGLLIGGVSYVIAMARAHTADLLAGDIELLADLVRVHLEPRAADARPPRPAHAEAETEAEGVQA